MMPKQAFLEEAKSIIMEYKNKKYGKKKMPKKLKNAEIILEHFNK